LALLQSKLTRIISTWELTGTARGTNFSVDIGASCKELAFLYLFIKTEPFAK